MRFGIYVDYKMKERRKNVAYTTIQNISWMTQDLKATNKF